MKTHTHFVLLYVLVSVIGCDRKELVGSGVAATERRTVTGFDEVSFAGSMSIELTIGEAGPVEITADDNILPVIKTEVAKGRLRVWPDESIRPRTPIKVKLAAPSVKAVFCAGATELAAHGLLGPKVRFELTGACKVTADGKVERLEISSTGAGSIHGSELQADHVEVDVTGAGKVEVNAIQTLKVSMTGAGTVRYRGDPKIEKSVIGVGTLQKE